jgi:hypothetical protein
MKRNRAVPLIASVTLLVSACQGRDLSSPLGGSSKTTARAAEMAAGASPITVFPIDITDQVTCDNGTSLTRSEVGRIQIHSFTQGNSGILELDSFHIDITFTNASGQTYTWRDVGPDKLSIQNGQLVLTITGRAGGHVGTFTIDPVTGAVLFSAGPDLGSPTTLACAALS